MKTDVARNTEWRKLYESGKLQKEIAEMYGVSRTTVTLALQRAKAEIRPHTVANRSYVYRNENCFESLDNEEAAYWFGFLCADGCVQTKSGRFILSINLQERDVSILEGLRTFIGVEEKPITTTRGKYVSFRVNSQKIVEDLIRHGCTTVKSKTLQYPAELIRHTAERHFLRGYLDGDGWVTSRKIAGKEYPTMGIVTGSIGLFTSLSARVREVAPVSAQWSDKSNAGGIRVYGEKNCAALYHYLYDGATVWLPRKRDKIEKLLKISAA